MRANPSRNPNVKLPDGTSWPWPASNGEDTPSLEWRLRYGEVSRGVMLEAASVVSAYQVLVNETRERRQFVVREIKKALRQRNSHPYGRNDV